MYVKGIESQSNLVGLNFVGATGFHSRVLALSVS
jgi:hypothetical protein